MDQALFAVVMEAYLHGVSTRKVDDLVKALGADTGITKSEVSRICADLDVEVGAFRDRSLGDQQFPYVFLDATYCKARVNHRVVSQAVVIATGVRADGWREVLGFAVGDSEDGAFWTAFLRSLKARGLGGVQLVISDAHTGLKQAISAVLIGAAWQRCRVHFLRNILAQVPKGNAEMVAAAIRTIFAQPDASHVREQLGVIAGMLGRQSAKIETMLRDAAEDLLAFTGFPPGHWKKIWSTNPLERLNKQVKRRTDVVGVFPNPEALLRLAGAVSVEAHDEWQATDRRYLSEATMALLATPPTQEKVATSALITARSEPQSLTRTELHHSAGHDHPSSPSPNASASPQSPRTTSGLGAVNLETRRCRRTTTTQGPSRRPQQFARARRPVHGFAPLSARGGRRDRRWNSTSHRDPSPGRHRGGASDSGGALGHRSPTVG